MGLQLRVARRLQTANLSIACRLARRGTAIAAAALALLAVAALPRHVGAAPPNQLRFKEDGTFKILMLTDLHYGDVNTTLDQLTDGVSRCYAARQTCAHKRSICMHVHLAAARAHSSSTWQGPWANPLACRCRPQCCHATPHQLLLLMQRPIPPLRTHRIPCATAGAAHGAVH